MKPSLLRTALSRRWLGGLVLAAVIAGLFGFLAQWQWSRSHEAPPPPAEETEKAKPLDSLYTPGRPLLGKEADHVVSVEGTFDPKLQTAVAHRLQSGDDGYWIVASLKVKGRDEWIPVVRGWSAEKSIPGGLPTGTVQLTGRILPPEAPVAGGDDKNPIEGTVAMLSPAELTNIWDVPLYDAFLVPRDKVPANAPETLERVVVGPQPQQPGISWLNVFYAVEWIVFAGFVFFMWFRLVRDDYERQLDEAALRSGVVGLREPGTEPAPASHTHEFDTMDVEPASSESTDKDPR